MLWLILSSILALAHFSQVSAAEKNQGNIKEIIVQAFEETTMRYEQKKNCFASTHDQAGFNNCLNLLDEEVRNLLLKYLNGSATMTPPTYSEEIRQKTVQAIDTQLQALHASISCVKQKSNATSMDHFSECFNTNNSAPQTGPNSAPPTTTPPTNSGGSGPTQLSDDW
jgi:hypothetical protein